MDQFMANILLQRLILSIYCILQLLTLQPVCSFYVADIILLKQHHHDNDTTTPTIGNWYLINPRNQECHLISDKISRDYLVKKASLSTVNLTVSELLPVIANHVLTTSTAHHDHNHYSNKPKAHCHYIGNPLPSFDLPERNNDEIIFRHMKLFEAIQGSPDFLVLSKFLPGCFNPSIARFNTDEKEYKHVQWMVSCMATKKGGLGLILLDNDLNIINNQSIYGIGPGIILPTGVGNSGEDFRLFDLDHDVSFLATQIVATIETDVNILNNKNKNRSLTPRFSISYNFYQNHSAQIRAAEISVIDEQLKVVSDSYLYDPQFANQHQKNWCPFVFNHQVMFLQNLWPHLTAVTFQTPKVDLTIDGNGVESLVSRVESFQQAEEMDIIWDFGMIKGGTPARRINNDSYLAFFHSKQYLTPNSKVSYVFGALTFDAEPPFNITAFSRTPIVHRKFYDGPWSHWGFIDYIVFPMSFVFENSSFDYRYCDHLCLKETNLLLSIGIQDKDGYIVKVNLKQLLHTLVKVQPLSMTSHHHRASR